MRPSVFAGAYVRASDRPEIERAFDLAEEAELLAAVRVKSPVLAALEATTEMAPWAMQAMEAVRSRPEPDFVHVETFSVHPLQ